MVDKVAIADLMLDAVELGGVADDLDCVTLGPVEVHDDLIADAVDPMVVQIIVLAGDAVPVDGAVIPGVLLDEALLGIDQGMEAEDVGAAATDHDIVAGDRLVG